jgi:hypothetical protein
MTTYQIVMDEEELLMFETIRILRRLRKEWTNSDPEKIHRLSQTVLIYGMVGDRRVGPWDIDAENAIVELAKVGSEIMKTLTSDEWNAPPEMAEPEEDSGDDPELEEKEEEEEEEEEPLSWDDIKKQLPEFVQSVRFTINAGISQDEYGKFKKKYAGVEIYPQASPRVGFSFSSRPEYQPSERSKALYQRWSQNRTLDLGSAKDDIPARVFTVLATNTTNRNKRYEDLLDLAIYAEVSMPSMPLFFAKGA